MKRLVAPGRVLILPSRANGTFRRRDPWPSHGHLVGINITPFATPPNFSVAIEWRLQSGDSFFYPLYIAPDSASAYAFYQTHWIGEWYNHTARALAYDKLTGGEYFFYLGY
jgi:hypothetical protein